MLMNRYSSYVSFDRPKWAHLKNENVDLSLSPTELDQLNGINEHVSMAEVSDIYMPLAHLIHLYVQNSRHLYTLTSSFFRTHQPKLPFIIGVAGSVAVGKSTFSRILQTILSRLDFPYQVDLVTTDGFLYSNRLLKQKKLMNRKGFPESYRVKKLLQFITDLKSGKPQLEVPVYCHLTYDVVHDQTQTLYNPDIVIVEGVNVLQVNGRQKVFVSDFFDFSIYIDAEETHIKQWYIDRFTVLLKTAFQQPSSYFHVQFSRLSEQEAMQKAVSIWEEINAVNLRENILPTKERARLIVQKGKNHSVEKIYLRNM